MTGFGLLPDEEPGPDDEAQRAAIKAAMDRRAGMWVAIDADGVIHFMSKHYNPVYRWVHNQAFFDDYNIRYEE